MFIFRKTCIEYFPYVLNPMSLCPLAKFWSSQLMLIGPHKNLHSFSVSIFPKYLRVTTRDCYLTTDFL